ncbi:PREDICTED: uncharacterized protein LOC107187641 [Dufourea novaeangliae]|uniref:uncharacterized protein LOC107187641 n=1 Tax=Dufourea novaeangliae TaxID=178035 RepID=UPI000767446E|nr:PREDICTED: uncharacterized protein LOC107187641 [Dufourea novaeangliae]
MGSQNPGGGTKDPVCSADSPKPIIDPKCKIALVVGGSDGFGFAAADHLLCRGARNVVIADDDLTSGKMAAQRLCDSHGKNRVQYVHCHIHNHCQFEAALNQIKCKYSDISIVFNNLDKEWPLVCNSMGKKENNTAKVIRTEMKTLGKKDGGPGGIIVNCASIFGFMGWPQEPYPIYCKNEPAIEVTMDFVKESKIEETGVRLVTLCPSNKYFSEIGLPDFPDPIPNNRICELPPCVPSSKHQIGSALSHVLAWAQNGSVWLVEPAISVHETPRLIHFPLKEGEKIDPKVYEIETCSVRTASPCVELSQINRSKRCPRIKTKVCEAKDKKKK